MIYGVTPVCFTKNWRSGKLFQAKSQRLFFRLFSYIFQYVIKGVSAMSFGGKFFLSPKKGVQKVKNMDLFRRPSSKRQNSRNLIKRYCRLIK